MYVCCNASRPETYPSEAKRSHLSHYNFLLPDVVGSIFIELNYNKLL